MIEVTILQNNFFPWCLFLTVLMKYLDFGTISVNIILWGLIYDDSSLV